MNNAERVIMEEVIEEFQSINKMELGSEQHVKTVQAANSMMDRLHKVEELRIEREKLELERSKIEVEEKKLSSDKKNSMVRNILTGASMIVFTGVTIWGYIDGKRFEADGFTMTNESGKSSERRLLSLIDKVKIF